MDRCASCPVESDGRYCSRIVPPDIPSEIESGGPCKALFLGAGPGKTEVKSLKPYSGRAGEELSDTYLQYAGLNRHDPDIAIWNVTGCWDGTDRPVSDKRVRSCATLHLPDLLSRLNPTVLVLMGGPTQRICDTRIRLDLHHGRPQYRSVLNGAWSGWVWPSFEPALGMRDTTQMSALIEDFRNLGGWLRGEWEPPQTDKILTDYQLIESVSQFNIYMLETAHILELACDTERHGDALWSIQISHTPGTARIIRTNNLPVMRAFIYFVKQVGVEWIFHHAPADLEPFERELGIAVSDLRGGFRDTMQEARHLCNLPQGLKALVYRMFGVEMKSWEDVVWPHSVNKMLEWLTDGISYAQQSPEAIVTEMRRGHCLHCGHYHSKGPSKTGCVTMELTKLKTEYRPSALESILTHIHRYTQADAEAQAEDPYDPWEKLAEMQGKGLRGRVVDPSGWRELEELVGSVPTLGIANAPLEEAVTYGCDDASWTLQVARELAHRRETETRWRVYPNDYGT